MILRDEPLIFEVVLSEAAATLCVTSSLTPVALCGSDPTDRFHFRTLSFVRPHDNRGTHFGYGCHILQM
jgi:hypothetical protein